MSDQGIREAVAEDPALDPTFRASHPILFFS